MINKKVISGLMACTFAFSLMAIGTASTTKADNKVPGSLMAPITQKLDKEVTDMAKKLGVTVKGQEYQGTSGKAYMKPEKNIGQLQYKNTKKATGIAILVDFPETEPGTSEVPGVKYTRVPVNYFNNLLNGTSYNPYALPTFSNLATYTEKDADGNVVKIHNAPTDRTLRNYYTEVSNGKFSVEVTMIDWVTLPHTYAYYMAQDKLMSNGQKMNNENGYAFISELVSDAIKEADKTVNFNDYAIAATADDLMTYEDLTAIPDQDGKAVTKIIPNVFIIHRGTGAEFSRDPSIIWSHKWDLISAKYFGNYDQTGSYMNEKELKYLTVDGVGINTYNICPEVGRDLSGYLDVVYPGKGYVPSAPSPAYPGVYAHEFGHVLGLPDQYDYGYTSEGTGMFTLMAGGSYGRNIPNGFYSGNTPVHMDAWSKYYLGFAQPQEIIPTSTKKQTITIRPVEDQNVGPNPDIFKVNVPGSNGREFFLLENRQELGYDQGLAYNVSKAPLHGLAIYQVSEDILFRNFDRPNEAANWDPNHLSNKSLFTDKGTGEHHYAVSLVQADAQYNMEKGVNDGDTGDLFPGKYSVTSLQSKTNAPINTTSIYKWSKGNTETGISFENIVENTDKSITLDVVFK